MTPINMNFFTSKLKSILTLILTLRITGLEIDLILFFLQIKKLYHWNLSRYLRHVLVDIESSIKDFTKKRQSNICSAKLTNVLSNYLMKHKYLFNSFSNWYR